MPALRMMITSDNLKVNLKVISHWKQFSFRETEIRLLLDFSKASVHFKSCFFLILVYIVTKLQWIKRAIIMKDLKNNISLFLEFLKNILISFLSTWDFIISHSIFLSLLLVREMVLIL